MRVFLLSYFTVLASRHLLIDSSSLIGDSTIIGEGTSVGADSTIRNSVIGRGCQIGAEVFIENAFLWDNVVVRKVQSCAHHSEYILTFMK